MKFILLIVNSSQAWQRLPADEQQAVIGRMNAFTEELKRAGAFVACGGLAPGSEAKTVRVKADGRTVDDGLALPLPEDQSHVTGFFLVEAPLMDAAIQWAQKMPVILDGGIEIRHVAQE